MDSLSRGNNDVDQLIRNAQLRTELEPFLDESVFMVDTHNMSTPVENEFLASLLAWESAPILPIAQWFDPALTLVSPQGLSDSQVSAALEEVVEKLFQKQIVLECTDHLTDRELYQLIARDILNSREKKVDFPGNVLTWHCVDPEDEQETWLRFYASQDERAMWSEFNPNRPLPPMELPPYPRALPR